MILIVKAHWKYRRRSYRASVTLAGTARALLEVLDDGGAWLGVAAAWRRSSGSPCQAQTEVVVEEELPAADAGRRAQTVREEDEVFLGRDARHAIADYLESERPRDTGQHSQALFLAASSISAHRPGGRHSPRSVNTNMTPYGEIQLRTNRRLDLTGTPPAAT